MSVAETVLIMD